MSDFSFSRLGDSGRVLTGVNEAGCFEIACSDVGNESAEFDLLLVELLDKSAFTFKFENSCFSSCITDLIVQGNYFINYIMLFINFAMFI